MPPSSNTPSGLILVAHTHQLPISHREMVEALPVAYKSLPQILVELDMEGIAAQALRSRDWGAAQSEQEKLFHAKLEPIRKANPDYRVVYFGASPIPLAIHLGFLLGTRQKVEVIPHHHVSRTWGWGAKPSEHTAVPLRTGLPKERDRTVGEAIIRVSTSHVVDALLTRRVVNTPLVEVELSLSPPSEDAFACQEELHGVAQAFREALDNIGDKFTGVERVHLFASVQPGMALLLGAQISPTMHSPVQTYQYARNADSGAANHVRAILVNAPPPMTRPELTAEQVARAQLDREQLAMDLERMKGLTQSVTAEGWRSQVFSSATEYEAFTHSWLHLPTLGETSLLEMSVDVTTRSVEDSFRLEPTENRWQLDDHWLARLAARLPDEASRHRALRLLVLHELAHRGRQMLTSFTSPGIGRFPKVLEEVDYHADVWAMLYEYALTRLQTPRDVSNVRLFFQDLVNIATNTMWAFDDEGPPPSEMQVRRINRYLIWAWQSLLLGRGAGRGQATNLSTVLSILAHRPIIELAGPELRTRGERIFFSLEVSPSIPELALYHEGQLHRVGSRTDFSITRLLEQFKAREAKGLMDALRPAFEQMVR
ncbi:SAVED domain-containing protein [Corallococcus terminator]